MRTRKGDFPATRKGQRCDRMWRSVNSSVTTLPMEGPDVQPLVAGPGPGAVRRLPRAVRVAPRRGEDLLPDLRRPLRRPAAAGDGARRADDLVGPRLLSPAGRPGLLRDPLRQPG